MAGDTPRIVMASELLVAKQLDEKVFGQGWNAEQYIVHLAAGWRCKVVGTVGKLRASMWYRWRHNGAIELETLAVARKYRAKGLGTALLKHLLDYRSDVYAWVREDNPKALKLYLRMGFLVLRRVAGHFPRKVAGIRIAWKAS